MDAFEAREKYIKRILRRKYMKVYTRKNVDYLNEQRRERSKRRRTSDEVLKEIKKVIKTYEKE